MFKNDLGQFWDAVLTVTGKSCLTSGKVRRDKNGQNMLNRQTMTCIKIVTDSLRKRLNHFPTVWRIILTICVFCTQKAVVGGCIVVKWNVFDHFRNALARCIQSLFQWCTRPSNNGAVIVAQLAEWLPPNQRSKVQIEPSAKFYTQHVLQVIV